jgi:UPF0755 protein
MRSFFWAAAAALVVLMLAAAWTVGVWWPEMLSPVADSTPDEVRVEVPPGASTQRVAKILHSKGLIRNQLVFRLYARLEELDGKLKAGEYMLSTGEALPAIMTHLVNGDVITYSFTIPEGYRVEQIVDRLVEKGYAERERLEELVSDPSFIEEFYEGGEDVKQPLEGFLFPETYTITRETTEQQLVELMVGRFKKVFGPEWRKRAEELNMSIYEVVTLASIIEEEAQKDEERDIISGVYHNRLGRGMKLDACPTVQYGLEKYDQLLLADLEKDTPYNTYIHGGLPPGPISNPGSASLKAALYPADVSYLYFVLCSDDGAHAFADTLREHNRNVRRCRNR